jgi:diguanylate cyclase
VTRENEQAWARANGEDLSARDGALLAHRPKYLPWWRLRLEEDGGKTIVAGRGEADALGAALERLLATPAGSVIFDQLAHLVAEWQGIEARIAPTYQRLLRLLVEDFAREPTSERVLALAGRLIQSRRATSVSVSHAVTLADFTQRLADDHGFHAALLTLLERLAMPAPAATTEQPAASVQERDVVSDGHGVEQRVNATYRQHLDHQCDEIDKMQGKLAAKVREAINQNKEFGDLLQIEHGALQQADSIQEVANLRRIVIGGIEELLHAQDALAENLTSTSEYLHLVESDSERLRAELQKVRLLSLTDEFTGLPNRRAFMRRLEDEIGRAQRYAAPLTLAMLDLDEFKCVNDTYGHAAGDRILRCYAEQVLSVFRHHDMVARYGGEEFAVLLPNTVIEGASNALRKVQNRAGQTLCIHEGVRLTLPTFSTGLALYQPGESAAALIERADRALYRAKHLGRNRIELELPDGQSPAITAVGDSSSDATGG